MLSVRFTRWHTDADIAQLVERILGKDEVTSSNLVISSISLAFCRAFFVFWGGFCIYKQNALQSRHFPDLIPIFLHLPLP